MSIVNTITKNSIIYPRNLVYHFYRLRVIVSRVDNMHPSTILYKNILDLALKVPILSAFMLDSYISISNKITQILNRFFNLREKGAPNNHIIASICALGESQWPYWRAKALKDLSSTFHSPALLMVSYLHFPAIPMKCSVQQNFQFIFYSL